MTHESTTVKPSISLRSLILTAIFLFSLLGTATFQVITNPHSVLAGSDTYPAPWAPPTAQDSMFDSWGEYNRECTSYAAWMLHSVNGFEMPFHDDAANWGTDATNAGYTVNMTPKKGSIYWTSSPQHVAWVEAVSSDGTTVTTEDYNAAYTGIYAEHSGVATNSASGYIHFKDLSTTKTNIGTWDGGDKTLPAVFRPSNGTWYYRTSNGGTVSQQYGVSGDIPVPGYYSGSTKPDYAVYRPSNETWYYKTQAGATGSRSFGLSGDIPVPGDYNGDGKTDYAVFRPSDSTWHYYDGGDVSFSFGLSGDIPVPAYWDGGAKTEYGIFRPSDGTWHYWTPTGEVAHQYGLSGDIPEPGYYSNSTKPDYAVFRPSNSTWYFLPQGGSSNSHAFGLSGDIPTPGSYSGAAKEDYGVFRPSNSTWYWLTQGGSSNSQAFGVSGDIPAVSTLPYPILHSLGLL